MKRQITKKEVIWHSAPNATDTSSATHGYYGVKRSTPIERLTGENHDGNSALCNRKMGISEDAEGFLSIDKVLQNSDYLSACKRCQKIFDSLPE